MASNTVGKNLRRLREAQDLSQTRLGGRADVNPATVNQIEAGGRSPNTATLERLAKVLQVPVAHFFEEDTDSPKASAAQSSSKVIQEQRRSPIEVVAAAADVWSRIASDQRIDSKEAFVLATVAEVLEGNLSVYLGDPEAWGQLSEREKRGITNLMSQLEKVSGRYHDGVAERVETDLRFKEIVREIVKDSKEKTRA